MALPMSTGGGWNGDLNLPTNLANFVRCLSECLTLLSWPSGKHQMGSAGRTQALATILRTMMLTPR